MPSNIFYISPEKKCQEKIEKGLLKAEQYALSLLKGTAKWGRIPLISDAMYLASRFGLALTRSRINQNLLPIPPLRIYVKNAGYVLNYVPWVTGK
ncbi:MAG: hypothetical protein AB1604_04830 [Euryarchaeota archaeon]